MAAKAISRRVKTLCSSRQYSLFDEAIAGNVDEIIAKPASAASLVCFEAPDPRNLSINGKPLEEHLQLAGLTTPLKLRPLLTTLSFTEFEASYRPGGRPPYAPRAMVGIILYGILQGLSSLRDLERLARADVGCWWLSGGIMPDHSVIGRFVRQHEALLTTDFFDQLARQVLKVTGSGTTVLAGDGTTIEAMASRFQLMREEALQQALAQAKETVQARPDDAAAVRRLSVLKQAEVELKSRQQKQAAKNKDPAKTQVQSNEPEAVLQPQKNSKDFRGSYKPTILANDKRVIVACDVHPSSETEVTPALLDRAQALGKVETVLLDAGFFSEGILEATAQRGIELLCPEGQSVKEDWNKQSDKQFPKNRFRYQADEDSYLCPNQQRLTRRNSCSGGQSGPAYTVYACDACADCPLKSQCTRSASGRKIKRYAVDAKKDALRAKMGSPEHRQRYRKRQAMMEPVFSQLRGRQGLHRFRRKGLAGVKVEFVLHAMAYNLGRALVVVLLHALYQSLRQIELVLWLFVRYLSVVSHKPRFRVIWANGADF
ncbi:MAG TPA: IS1182 family transposase [Nitrosomonas nitrosa]|nr:IS1182 family transposase [Nitrosomonas nitrosa]HNP51319.1 IS1182 family transposase [Nitrosomonas nitrosa]